MGHWCCGVGTSNTQQPSTDLVCAGWVREGLRYLIFIPYEPDAIRIRRNLYAIRGIYNSPTALMGHWCCGVDTSNTQQPNTDLVCAWWVGEGLRYLIFIPYEPYSIRIRIRTILTQFKESRDKSNLKL